MKHLFSSQLHFEEPRVVPSHPASRLLINAIVLLALLAAEGRRCVQAQGSEPLAAVKPDLVASPAVPTETTNTLVKEIGNGRLQIGLVILDKSQRSITFPTSVNMSNGMVEYFLVTGSGKVHESVLRTEVQPYHLHIGMILLGAKGAMDADPAVFYDPRKPIPGDKITIELSWEAGKKRITRRAEELVQNTQAKESMSKGPWTYNGSQKVDGNFVAQREGSIIAIMADPYALINNPRKGRENDEIWYASTNMVPALSTPVDVTIRLEKTD